VSDDRTPGAHSGPEPVLEDVLARLKGPIVDGDERDGAIRALEEAERRYRQLVETIPAVVWLDRIDEESSNIYMSPQVEAMLGYPLSAWEEDPAFWTKVVHPDDLPGVIERIGTLTVPHHYAMEFRVLAADGRTVWVHDEAVPVFEEDGTPLFWQGVWLDVTERHEASTSISWTRRARTSTRARRPRRCSGTRCRSGRRTRGNGSICSTPTTATAS
jgi:PAS domain S-box-containing protein